VEQDDGGLLQGQGELGRAVVFVAEADAESDPGQAPSARGTLSGLAGSTS
jgi:hypothetical protein